MSGEKTTEVRDKDGEKSFGQAIPLNYLGRIASAAPYASDVPDPCLAAALCVPGITCWVILLSAVACQFDMKDLDSLFLIGVCSWFVAIILAFASYILYFGRFRYWYVWVNLFVSGSVLAFTAFIVVLGLVLTATH